MATRRDVLKSGTLAAAAIALPLPSWARSTETGSAAGPPPLSRSGLAPLVGGRLLAESPTGQPLELILLEVKDTPTASLAQTSNRDDCFIAVFEGSEPGVQQGTYRVRSPATGEMQIFLVPGPCPDADRCYLIATINRVMR
jgi:hypothetical protein